VINCILSSIIEFYNKKNYKKNDDTDITLMDHIGKIACLSLCSVILAGGGIMISKITNCPTSDNTLSEN
jgi:hypothetical protein